jgi:hypothetical protein
MNCVATTIKISLGRVYKAASHGVGKMVVEAIRAICENVRRQLGNAGSHVQFGCSLLPALTAVIGEERDAVEALGTLDGARGILVAIVGAAPRPVIRFSQPDTGIAADRMLQGGY